LNIVLFGPPGAGKGTQSALLIERRSMKHISTGDLLRAAVKAKTELGLKAKAIMDAGNLVPDDVMIKMVEEVLISDGTANSAQGFILDGFPRTVPQAEALEAMLVKHSLKIDRAVFVEVPNETLVRRLTGRRVCVSCGAVYHVDSKPPTRDGVCDVCGSEVVQRKDDRAEVISTRLQAYETSTSPLKDYYLRKGALSTVDGVGETEEVYHRLNADLS
jgi:adenylate kinase